MTKIFFVRHAQPEHAWQEDRTRPLTLEGKEDSNIVLAFFKDKQVDAFYSSPYKRSIDTIAETAVYFGKEIIMDERLREREKGPDGNNHGMFRKRWEDHDYHEDGGESIAMVQKRNVEALQEILVKHSNEAIVVGTHGTALSSILNFFDNRFGCEDFLRIIDWMPYIIELDFEGNKLIGKCEHCHVEKEFKGNQRADIPNYEIIPLPKSQWRHAIIPMRYTTEEYYDVKIEKTESGYQVNFEKKPLDTPISHYPEEYDFPDKLYQDHWEKASAWGVVEEIDGKQEMVACIETCPEEWSNRLMVTELWVHEKLRRKGIGHALMAVAKEQAKSENRRAIILETQSCNVGAISFYLQEGFELIGFDSCCYSNRDVERKEVRLDFGHY